MEEKKQYLARLINTTKQKEELIEKLSEKQAKINKSFKEDTAQHEELLKTLQPLTAKIQKLSKKADELRKQNSELAKQNSDFIDEADKLGKDVSDLKKEKQVLARDVGLLKAQKTNAQKQINTLKKKESTIIKEAKEQAAEEPEEQPVKKQPREAAEEPTRGEQADQKHAEPDTGSEFEDIKKMIAQTRGLIRDNSLNQAKEWLDKVQLRLKKSKLEATQKKILSYAILDLETDFNLAKLE